MQENCTIYSRLGCDIHIGSAEVVLLVSIFLCDIFLIFDDLFADICPKFKNTRKICKAIPSVKLLCPESCHIPIDEQMS